MIIYNDNTTESQFVYYVYAYLRDDLSPYYIGKQKMSEDRKGKILSEEHKMKMRKPHQTVECPHCLKIGGKANMKRWHFDNCRLANNCWR